MVYHVFQFIHLFPYFLTALVDMVVVAILEPLGFVGKSIGAFFDNVLGNKR